MKRGEIYYLRDTKSYGHEIAMGRPVVIVSPDDEIAKNDVVTVAFMTTTPRGYLGTAVETRVMDRVSWILCNQLSTVDQNRICDKRATLSDFELARVDECLAVALGLSVVQEVVAPEIDETKDRIESELYQKLYTKAMADLVEARYKLDELQLKYNRVEKSKARINDEFGVGGLREDSGISVDLDALKKNMCTPNYVMTGEFVEPVGRDEEIPKELGKSSGAKIGRPRTNGKFSRPTREDVMGSWHPGKANINKDGWESIMAISGMPCDTARQIIAHRNKNGMYRHVNDLLNVGRFTQGILNKYGPYLEV